MILVIVYIFVSAFRPSEESIGKCLRITLVEKIFYHYQAKREVETSHTGQVTSS